VRSLDPQGRATQTNLELKAVRAVRDAGFPEPELQAPVVDGDGRKRRLDLAWPGRLLDLETDGDRWHTSPRDRQAMTVRDDALRAVGYEVVRIDSDDVEHDLRGVIARLRPFFGG
jgi:very-short-patch-repair endonuclease